MVEIFGDLKITSTSTDRQKRSQNLAPGTGNNFWEFSGIF